MHRRPSARSGAVLSLTAGMAVALLAGCGQEEAPGNENTITQEPTAATEEVSSPAATAPEPEETTAASPVEPLTINAGGILGGSASPEFDAGEPGVVSAVYVGMFDSEMSILPFVLRNNTDEPVAHVDATATIRDASGGLAATGASQGTTPSQIPPGGLSLGYIYLDQGEVPEGATFEFAFNTLPADTSSYNTADLRVTELGETGGGLIGTAVNETGGSLEGPFSLQVYCFEDSTLTDYFGSFANEDGPIGADGTVSFSVDFYGESCPSYLVGVSGWFS